MPTTFATEILPSLTKPGVPGEIVHFYLRIGDTGVIRSARPTRPPFARENPANGEIEN
jgi:hypothetical protein